MAITKRCNRCLKPMRNDGTEEQPKWVCNNPKCVKYVPPQPKPDPEPTEDNTAPSAKRQAVRDEINKLQAEPETK